MGVNILGLDPGTATTGWGVVTFEGGNLKHIAHGVVTTPKDLPAADRLVMIVDQIGEIMEKYQPGLIAVEELFFASNITTAINVAQARGAMIATAARFSIPIAGYTPLQVKQAITGDGGADKRAVQKMITMILGLSEIPHPDDAADALAIAITHAHSHKYNEIISQ